VFCDKLMVHGVPETLIEYVGDGVAMRVGVGGGVRVNEPDNVKSFVCDGVADGVSVGG
jgi:hypothetical protein